MYGCIKCDYDSRDILVMTYLDVSVPPESYDLTNEQSEVRSQGKEGACTGFSALGAKEWQESQDYGIFVPLSPRFAYEEAKKLYWGKNARKKEGADLRSIVKVLTKLGICEEKFWPYEAGNPETMGNITETYQSASEFKIKSYARITNLEDLKRSLVKFGPCLIGWLVYKGIKKAKENGVVPTPNMAWPSNWRPLGGHATVAVGFDDNMKALGKKGYIKFKNSWGIGWGEEGYGYLSYDYIKDHMLDAFSMLDIDDPKPFTVGDLSYIQKDEAWV